MMSLRVMVLGRMGWTTSPHPRACALSCPSPAIHGAGLSGTHPARVGSTVLAGFANPFRGITCRSLLVTGRNGGGERSNPPLYSLYPPTENPSRDRGPYAKIVSTSKPTKMPRQRCCRKRADAALAAASPLHLCAPPTPSWLSHRGSLSPCS
jgi:hypothetical protein